MEQRERASGATRAHRRKKSFQGEIIARLSHRPEHREQSEKSGQDRWAARQSL